MSASEGQQQGQIAATARLNHKLMPIDRGNIYEDPLDAELRKHGVGQTDGGGTMMGVSKEIDFIDVEVVLTDAVKGIPLVIKTLESCGAPKGSKLIINNESVTREIEFGQIEGFGIYLDGINLPDETYKICDVNLVIEEINKALEGHGKMTSHWQGPKETALYIYGDNAESMKKLIAPFVESYPLCKNARVVTLAPKIV